MSARCGRWTPKDPSKPASTRNSRMRYPPNYRVLAVLLVSGLSSVATQKRAAMMARFDRNVPRPRLPLLRPQQVLRVLLLLLAGMAGRTGANLACFKGAYNQNPSSIGKFWYFLMDTTSDYWECTAVHEMNVAFAGELSRCDQVGLVSRARWCTNLFFLTICWRTSHK